MVHRCVTNIDAEVLTVPPSPVGLSITVMLSLYLVCTCWQKCPSVSLFSSNNYLVNEFPSFSSASLPLFYINKISLQYLQVT